MLKLFTLYISIFLFFSCEFDPSKFPIIGGGNKPLPVTQNSAQVSGQRGSSTLDAGEVESASYQQPFEYYADFYGQEGAAEYLPKPFPRLNSYIKKITDPPTTRCRAEEPIHYGDMPKVDENVKVVSDGSDKAETLKWITENLKGGTYKFQRAPGPLKAADHADICRSFNAALDGEVVETPQAGHCASASFLGVILMLKKHRPDVLQKHGDEFRCRPSANSWKGWIYGESYKLFANNYNAWVKKYLGKDSLKWVPQSGLDKFSKQGTPEPGDSVVINRRGSGHSVIFSHFIKNAGGRISQICYWSSNSDPYDHYKHEDGMGMRCENRSRIKSLSVGKI